MSTPYPIYNNKPIDQWKVTELKEELRRRNLKMNGLKEELVRRLDEALSSEMTPDQEEELGNGFDPDNDSENNVDQKDPEKNSEQPAAENNTGRVEDQSKKVGEIAMVGIDDSTSDVNKGTEGHYQKEISGTTTDLAVEDTSGDTVLVNSVIDDKNELDPNNQDVNYDVNTEDSKSPTENVELTLPESANQVSEVSQDLEFQVKCELISNDSVSINEKNELKDNLNANNVHLEVEVVKPEVVQPSTTDMPTTGGELHPLEHDKDLVDNQSSLEDVVDATCAMDMELKVDSVDGGSPEKLSLDRSSGDELMEEDMLESKQIESKNNSDEVGEMNEDHKVEVVQMANPVDATVGGFPPEKKEMVSEDVIKPTAAVEKRKVEDLEAVAINEPKRQRQWFSETIKAAEPPTANLTAAALKDVFQPSFRRSLSRTDSSLSGEAPKERVVPPPLRAATTSLRINNFLRPFTLKAVQELLAKTGTFSDFWMDQIKTHCYVTYSSVEEAEATRNALYNLQWPANGGRLLTVEFVDCQEVKSRLKAPQSSVPITPSPTAPTAPPFQHQTQPLLAPHHPLRQERLPPPPPLPPPPALSNPPPVREQLPPPPLLKKPEPPFVTLDDLFKKTKAIPRIYYLPLSEEQVAARLVVQGKSAQEGQ